MALSLENLVEKPLAVKIGVVGGSLVLVIAIFWFGFYSSVYTQIAELEKEVSDKTKQIAEKKRIASNLSKYTAEVAALDMQFKRALEELPTAREIPSLLSKIADQASTSGLEVKLFKPQTEHKSEFYAEVPVEIQLRGTYHEVGTFFDEVSRLDRVVNISNYKLAEPQIGEENTTLVTSLIATAYRFLEESERPKPEVEEDKNTKNKPRRGPKNKH